MSAAAEPSCARMTSLLAAGCPRYNFCMKKLLFLTAAAAVSGCVRLGEPFDGGEYRMSQQAYGLIVVNVSSYDKVPVDVKTKDFAVHVLDPDVSTGGKDAGR